MSTELLNLDFGWIWLIALVAFIILEAATVQMVAIWFIAGSVAAFIASLLGVNLTWQVIIFIAVSALSLLLLRPIAKKKLEPKIVATNADMVIGKTAVVIESIDNDEDKGRARVSGVDWTARSYYKTKIKKDTKVTVVAIDGVKLIVVPENEEVTK